HFLPSVHLAHEPPQSTSVSSPSLVPSVHSSRQEPPVHAWLLQSENFRQLCPALHAPHEPPQSRSVSSPFFTLSAQCGPALGSPVRPPTVEPQPAATSPHQIHRRM